MKINLFFAACVICVFLCGVIGCADKPKYTLSYEEALAFAERQSGGLKTELFKVNHTFYGLGVDERGITGPYNWQTSVQMSSSGKDRPTLSVHMAGGASVAWSPQDGIVGTFICYAFKNKYNDVVFVIRKIITDDSETDDSE